MANEPNKKDKRFLKDFKAELKKVIWPSSKQLINSTLAVVVIVLIIAAIVFVLDVAFESMNTYGIEKIKSLVTSSDVTDNSDVVENDVNSEVLDNDGSSITPTVEPIDETTDVITDETTDETDEATPEVDNTVEPDDSDITDDSEE